MLIAVIVTVIYSITAVVTGHTPAVATGKGKGAALLHGRFTGWVFLACQVIGSQTHSIRATTYPLEIWHREAEVAAVTIRMCGSITVVRTWKSNAGRRRTVSYVHFHWVDHRCSLWRKTNKKRTMFRLNTTKWLLSGNQYAKYNIQYKHREVLKICFPNNTSRVNRAEQKL